MKEARVAAIEWVMNHASREDGFRGAYISGSTIELPDNAELPSYSDIDVVVVIALDELPLKLGKFIYRETLIEVTYLSWTQLTSIKEVLKSYHLAGSFRMDTIISDPTGHLRKLQKAVSRYYADMFWVRHRCNNAIQRIEEGLRAIDASVPLYDLVTSWLFPTGITTHVILVAALRNPTVRLRYLVARDVLIEYGHADFYTDLLNLLGCTHLSPNCVEYHLDALSRTFDVASVEGKTPFFFSTDIAATSKRIAIEGSRHLIRTGNHREAVFWIVATFARCHKILATDAPSLHHEHSYAFEAMIADLGITSTDILIRRAKDVIQFLPRLRHTTEALLLANPSIDPK